MAEVSIVDIGGVQWTIKDQTARSDIETLSQSLEVIGKEDISLTINNGYTASLANIQYCQQSGKLNMGLLNINDLAGASINTINRINIGMVNINVVKQTHAIGLDYRSGTSVRVIINPNKTVSFQGSTNMTSGNNLIRIPIVWLEA